MSSSVSRPLGTSFAAHGRADAAARRRPPSRRAALQPIQRRSSGGVPHGRLAALVGTIVVVWIVVVFARAVADSASSTARADAVRRDTATAAAQLLAERAELLLIQTPAYIRLEARAYGYGLPGERAFALEPGGPAAPVITPLGEDPAGARPRSPLDAWLQLLLGP